MTANNCWRIINKIKMRNNKNNNGSGNYSKSFFLNLKNKNRENTNTEINKLRTNQKITELEQKNIKK